MKTKSGEADPNIFYCDGCGFYRPRRELAEMTPTFDAGVIRMCYLCKPKNRPIKGCSGIIRDCDNCKSRNSCFRIEAAISKIEKLGE